MSFTQILMDVGPPGGVVGVFAAVAFFVVLAAVAFIAFKLLKKTVGMAIRVLVVLLVLAIAVAGTAAFFFLGTGGSKPPRPRTNQTR
ncbi:MAG: hypothetical protein ABI999_15175 [Acidobacteriota bacterium]